MFWGAGYVDWQVSYPADLSATFGNQPDAHGASGLGFSGRRESRGAASPCGPPVTNVIACENAQPGDPPSDWQVKGSGDPTIQGFATSMSVNVGQTESFKINTPSKSYHIDILRVGRYQGDGARIVAEDILPTAPLPQSQPACKHESAPTSVHCGNWAVSASWPVPRDAVPGLYLAHLKRDDTTKGNGSLIPFVVRDKASHDTTPPASTITSPAKGATVTHGSAVTVKGTARDAGGGVAGVMISTDDGATWHPVTRMSAREHFRDLEIFVDCS